MIFKNSFFREKKLQNLKLFFLKIINCIKRWPFKAQLCSPLRSVPVYSSIILFIYATLWGLCPKCLPIIPNDSASPVCAWLYIILFIICLNVFDKCYLFDGRENCLYVIICLLKVQSIHNFFQVKIGSCKLD